MHWKGRERTKVRARAWRLMGAHVLWTLGRSCRRHNLFCSAEREEGEGVRFSGRECLFPMHQRLVD